MKTILQIIFQLLTINSFAQNSLFINFEPNDKLENDFHIFKNDPLIYKYCESHYKNNEQLYNLEKGNYKIIYNSINGKDSLNVSFSFDKDTKEIELFTEKINFDKIKKSKSEIESLKNGENLTLLYSNINCYTPKDLKMTILKKNGNFYEIKNNKKKKIKNKIITFLINYEKILNTGSFDNALHPDYQTISTASIKFELVKNNYTIYSRRLFSGWEEMHKIENYIK